MATRQEHLEWCKRRALKYVEIDDLKNAFASMTSDLRKHAETKNHPAIELGLMLMLSGGLSTRAEMQKFIEDFN